MSETTALREVLKNGNTTPTGLTIDPETELQELRKEIERLLQLEKKPPLKNGILDFETYHAQLRARFALQEEYKEKKAEFKAMLEYRQRLAKIVFSPEEKVECLRIKETYGIPLDFDDRQLDLYQIIRAEKANAACEGCKGLPCQKKYGWLNPNAVYTFQYIHEFNCKAFTIRSTPCKYAEAQSAQKKIARLQGLSKIPAEYLGKTFADYQVDEDNGYAVKMAKKLLEHTDKGAYFYGKVGTGKTLLAAIVAQELIKQGRQVIFATVPAISKQLRSTFNGKSETTESEILAQLETAQTLILDDVGMEKPTRFICGTICNLFNERYNSRLQTIMTSNYTLKELESIFNNPTDGNATLDGTRIYDRCKQMCLPIELKGTSRRA